MPTASYLPSRRSSPAAGLFRDDYDEDDDALFGATAESAMRESLSNPFAVVQAIRKNAENQYIESLDIGDYFDAAWTGAKHGFATHGPEMYYRAIHTLGSMLNSEGIQAWAREGIEEHLAIREKDPWYRPDPRWAQSDFANALYQGFASVASSLELSIPGILVAGLAPAAGGSLAGAGLFAKLGSMYFGKVVSGGALAGLAEYNSFVDEAYEQARVVDPNVTRDMIESDKFWQAALSGTGEAAFEFAGDAFAGRIAGILGKQAAKPVSGVLQKAIRNVTYGMASELGSEAATAAWQDYMKEWAGMDHQGRLRAVLDVIGPTLVAGAVGGVQNTVLGQVAQQTPQEAEAASLAKLQEITARKRMESLSPHAFAEYQQMLGAGVEGRQAHAEMLVADALANRLAGEIGESPSVVLQGMRESFSQMRDFVASLRNTEATFDEVVDNSLEFLLGRLDGPSQALVGSIYADPVTGNVNGLALAEDLKALIREKPVAENSPLALLQADPEVAGALQAMKRTFLDSAVTLDSQSTVKISGETRDTINATEARKQFQAAAEPVVSFDKASAEVLTERWKGKDLSTPENQRQYLEESAGAVSYNFDSIEPNADNLEGVYKQIKKSLDNILEPLRQARKRKPDAVTQANAQKKLEANTTLRSFLEKAAGTKNLDEAVVEMQLVIKAADAQFKNMARILAEGGGGADLEFQALALMEHTKALKAVYDGTGTEIARALRARRNLTKNDPLYAEKMSALLNTVATPDARNKFFVAVSNIDNQEVLNKIVKIPLGARTTDAIMEYITSNLLFGPSTHITNLIGNTVNVMNRVFSRFLAERIALPEMGGVVRGETLDMLYGFWGGFNQLRETWKTHRDQYDGGWAGTFGALRDASDIWAKRDMGSTQGSDASNQRMRRAISRENALAVAEKLKGVVGLSTEHGRITNGAATLIDYFGKIVGIPFVLLEHSDNIFKTVYQAGELQALIHRAANGDIKLKAAMQKNPPVDLINQARDAARQALFQEDYGKVGKALNDIRNAAPMTRLFMPFLKTPINIMKEGMRMMPIVSDMFAFTRRDLNSPDAATRQIAEARVMTGTLIMSTAVALAANGMLTGSGPDDPDERKRWLATGRRPNSLVVGDQYFQLDRLDPLAALLNAAALMVEARDIMDDEDAVRAGWTLLGQAIDIAGSRTYLSSLTDLVGFLTAPERNAPAFLRRVGGMLVPASSLMQTVNRDDPYMREVDDFWDGIKQNLPGFSKALPQRRDFLGQPMESNDYVGPDYFSPFVVSAKKNDPVYEEVLRLQNLGLRSASIPNRTISNGGLSVRMSGEEYSAFLDHYGNKTKIGGKSLYQALGRLVADPMYTARTDEDKAVAIRALTMRYSREARKTFLQETPRLQASLNRKSRGWEYLLGSTLSTTSP